MGGGWFALAAISWSRSDPVLTQKARGGCQCMDHGRTDMRPVLATSTRMLNERTTSREATKPLSRLLLKIMANPLRTAALCVLLLACCSVHVHSFAPESTPFSRRSATALAAQKKSSTEGISNVVATSALAVALSFGIVASPALADEYGRETEAPTLFTGENVMICKKRGPLGACIETVERTAENDNDKASKYFHDPSADVKAKYDTMTKEVQTEADGNELIQKLLQQTAENKERNDRIVKQKTLMNDQGASFGPFSGQVVIMNADGEGFTVLYNPQAMRLKEAGYIKDRRFVKQPTKEVIDQALEAPEGGGGMFKGLFGGGEE